MKQTNNGGMAFPTSDPAVAHTIATAAIEGIEDSAERDRVYIAARAQAQQGMSLRDYFAAQAPIGVDDANDAFFRENGRNARQSEMLATLAGLRGLYADAMLKERAK